MLHQIADRFRRGRECTRVRLMNCEDVRLSLDRFTKSSGHPGFLIEVQVDPDLKDEWITIACFGDIHLGAAIRLLTAAGDFVNTELVEHFAPQYVD